MEDLLPVVECEIRGGGHRGKIPFPMLALDRRCNELPVGETFSKAELNKLIKCVLADLVAESTRA